MWWCCLLDERACGLQVIFFFKAKGGIRELGGSRGLGDGYRRQGGGPVSGSPTPWRESLGGPGAFPPQAAMQQMAPMTPAALPEMKQMAGQPAVPLPGQQEGP